MSYRSRLPSKGKVLFYVVSRKALLALRYITMPIVDQTTRNKKPLVVGDGGVIHIAGRKNPTADYFRLIREISPEDSRIRLHVPHHKEVPEQRDFLAPQGIELISTPPVWCRSKCSTSISMLSDLFIMGAQSQEVILISGSVDFTIAVQWLWNVHTVPTTVAVPKGVRVSKSLLQVARSFITLEHESTSHHHV